MRKIQDVSHIARQTITASAARYVANVPAPGNAGRAATGIRLASSPKYTVIGAAAECQTGTVAPGEKASDGSAFTNCRPARSSPTRLTWSVSPSMWPAMYGEPPLGRNSSMTYVTCRYDDPYHQ